MKYATLILFVLSTLSCCFFPEQDDFLMISILFAVAFGSYLLLVNKFDFGLSILIPVAIGVRVGVVFCFPNLSDDIYRFIWDGTLIHMGINPFQYVPSDLLGDPSFTNLASLYPLLNSQDYYSVYPPFAQMLFYIASGAGPDNIFLSSILIKVMMLIAEVLTIVYGVKLLNLMKISRNNILWYALNPLIIVEVMGNVHFEGFMVCFFVLFLYFLKKSKVTVSAIFITLSISVKLIPLLFLPYFLFKWKWSKSLKFYAIIGLSLILIFSPLVFQSSGFADSLDLYFRKFEFNASIYYLFRSLGWFVYGYNNISLIGPVLGITVFFAITYRSLVAGKRFIDFIEFIQIALAIFLLLSTTVHPWYLCLGVLTCVFTKNKYFVVWSALIVLSYSKYTDIEQLYYWMVFLEYGLFSVFVFWDTGFINKKTPGLLVGKKKN